MRQTTAKLTRRTLLLASLTGSIAAEAFAQDESLEPGPGEILLEGKIVGGSRKERKMTLLVDKVVTSTKTPTDIKPPRPREVQLTPQTKAVNVSNAGQPLVPEGLVLDLRVGVIVKDLGAGKVLPCRLILVDTATPEQRTLLENGQLAVATQTFTRVGEKAWWNFRCSDAAKATMTAYREGLQIAVEKPAEQYDVQLQQGDIAVSEGDIVTVSFRARANRPRSLHLEAQSIGGNYPAIGLERDIALTKEWQNFNFTFTAKQVGARNQVTFGVGQEVGTVALEAIKITVAPSGARKPVAAAPVAKSGTTPFTGPLVTQLDLISVLGKRYDFAKGGEQPFTLLVSTVEEPARLVPMILNARLTPDTLMTEDGPLTVQTVWLRRAADKEIFGYVMVGPDKEFIKAEIGDKLFPENLYRMQGPATKTDTGFDLVMQEPYRNRLRVEKQGDGWRIRLLLPNGNAVGFVETDAVYNPVRVQFPIGGDITARVFTATIKEGKIVWELPLR